VLNVVRSEALGEAVDLGGGEPETRMKAMPADVGQRVYQAHKSNYDSIQREVPAFDKSDLGASVLLISGCQDNKPRVRARAAVYDLASPLSTNPASQSRAHRPPRPRPR